MKAETVSGGRYVPVTVTKPSGPLRGFVVLFSREAGWNAADQQAAEALAKAGAMTVGVDSERYAMNLAAKQETPRSPRRRRRSGQSPARAPCTVVALLHADRRGRRLRGTIAKQILSMAPENTIAGVVSVDPAAKLDPLSPCPPDPTIVRRAMPGFVDTAATGDSAKLVSLVTSHLLDTTRGDELDVSDLLLVELPAKGGNGQLAIVISGDGGWRDLDKTIAEALQRDGVSVVGIDSLRYF